MKRFALVLAASLVTARASAAPSAAEAEALFEAARALVEKGDFAAACPKFAESQRLDPGVGTLMNLADCEEHTAHLVDAWQNWRTAVEELTAKKDDRLAYAQRRLAALDKRVPRLLVHLPSAAPPGTQVRRDGVPIASAAFDVPIPVDPGEHVVEVLAPGRPRAEARFTIADGEQREVLAAPGNASAEEQKPPPGVSIKAPDKQTIGWIAGGVGVASLATSVIAGVLVLSKKSTVLDHCNSVRECDQQGLDAGDAGKTLSTVSTVSFVLGVVGLGVGTYLLFFDSPKSKAQITASALRGGGAVGVSGAF